MKIGSILIIFRSRSLHFVSSASYQSSRLFRQVALNDDGLTPEDTDLRPLLLSLPDQFMDIYTEGEELASRGGWDTEHDTGNVQCGDGWLPPVCSCFQGTD